MESEAIEKVLLTGDLAALTPDQRLAYYKSVCESLGLNPLTQPFGYITFDGRMQLYAKKDATEQLRKRHHVSITDLQQVIRDSVIITTVKAQDKEGRTDMATGATTSTYTTDNGAVKPLLGVGLANAIMKSETKAKRRVTLSICGLGMMDESEIEDLSQPPQLPDRDKTAERNVRQATENATAAEPKRITAGNSHGDVVVHIGKAEGEMLGKKVSELHDNVVDWLHNKWRDKLNPISATDQDMKLKLAVESEYKKRHAAAPAPAEPQKDTPATTEPPLDRAAILGWLQERCDELVMTGQQFMGYLKLAGFNTDGAFTHQLKDEQLRYIHDKWHEVKPIIEAAVKPKVSEQPKKAKKKGSAHKL